MICGRCGMWYSVGDNYCRRCGAPLAENLPAVPAERRLVRLSQAVPPIVWKGVAALVASKVLEWGTRAAARRVLEAAPGVLAALVRGRESTSRPDLSLAQPKRNGTVHNSGLVVETFVLLRRIRVLPGPAERTDGVTMRWSGSPRGGWHSR